MPAKTTERYYRNGKVVFERTIEEPDLASFVSDQPCPTCGAPGHTNRGDCIGCDFEWNTARINYEAYLESQNGSPDERR